MKQIRIILQRLKSPSVILSIVSQIIAILLLLKVDVDVNIVTGIATAICSVLVLLGIMSNPDTQNIGYGDDIKVCKNCGKKSVHLTVNGEMVCSECGNVSNKS